MLIEFHNSSSRVVATRLVHRSWLTISPKMRTLPGFPLLTVALARSTMRWIVEIGGHYEDYALAIANERDRLLDVILIHVWVHDVGAWVRIG